MNDVNSAIKLLDFINQSPTAFHAVKNAGKILKNNGFIELKTADDWDLKKGKKYYVARNNSALIAFRVGSGNLDRDGFRLIGAHVDSPGFRIKPNSEMVESNTYLKLNTEVYGGPILNTWFDRPLSLAGKVVLKSSNTFKPEITTVKINRPILVIPNLAIHLNRDVNKGIELNKQVDLLPLLAMVNEKFEKDNYLLKIIAGELGLEPDDIIDFDLFLYEYEPGKIVGLNDEFISASRLDDLAMVHAGLTAITDRVKNKCTNLLVLFDNEEVGSRTKQGAASPMLRNIMERIVINLGGESEDFFKVLSNSFIISADMAHAVHPNHTEKHDPTNRPYLNKGPVIKISAQQHYTSDSETISVYKQLCNRVDIPYQEFVNRSDQKGGSTIGPIISSQLDIRTIDIGNPLLAMHSIRELAGIKDHYHIIKSFKEYFRL
ncbi:MAG: M18 family aminopeptidase [Halothermotrichaceae bacterium]